MTRRTSWNHTPAFKAQVALVALKSDETLAELAQQDDHSPQPDHGLEAATDGACGSGFWGCRRSCEQ
jgi:transposase-like protein